MRKVVVGIVAVAGCSLGACDVMNSAPTLEELESQVNSLANDCMTDYSQECEQRKDDFCNALSAYIDKNGSLDLHAVDSMKFMFFGNRCPGLYLE